MPAAQERSSWGSRSRWGRSCLALALVLGGSLLSGCFSVRYLWQATGGELELLRKAQPLEVASQDRRVPRQARELLAEVPRIKAFGERQGLTATANYTTYVDLDRPAVVWVVSACAPLAFESRTWQFPVVGRVPYLGFWDEAEAQDEARRLRAEGLDVDVRGTTAFSTLGWFRDPVLSTMLERGDTAAGALAEVILHESVHATVFLPGEVDLNERLADFVASKLAPAYLRASRGEGAVELDAWRESEHWVEGRRARLHAAYGALEALYASSRPREEKIALKGALLEALARDLGSARLLNNATLSQFRTYHRPLPELDALLRACDGSVARMMRALQTLQPGVEPLPELRRLASDGCVASPR